MEGFRGRRQTMISNTAKENRPAPVQPCLELLSAEADRAYCTAMRVTKNPALAEEVVQDAFLQVLRKPPKVMEREQTLAYFLKAVHGLGINAIRASRVRQRREERFAATRQQRNSSVPPDASQKELAHAAQAAMENLPDQERVAVSLCCEQGLTRRTASGVLGVHERTVSKQVNRGLDKLRAILAARGFTSAMPIAIAGALTSMGTLKAPVALTASLAELGAKAATMGVQHGIQAAASTGAKASLKTIAAKKAAVGSGLSAKAALVAAFAIGSPVAYLALKTDPQMPTRTAVKAPTPPPKEQADPSPILPTPSITPSAPGAKASKLTAKAAAKRNATPLLRSETRFDFDSIAENQWTPNKLVRLQEAGGDITAIVSVPYSGGSPAWNPDVYIELSRAFSSKAKSEVLYTLPESAVVKIRVKSERPGRIGLSQMVSRPRFASEHFYTGEWKVGTDWQELLVHARDMKPYRRGAHTRDLVPDTKIGSTVIVGFDTGRLWVDRYEILTKIPDGPSPDKDPQDNF